MTHDSSTPDLMDAIAEHGHAVIGTATPDGSPLAYTVGRTLKGRAELVVGAPLHSELSRRLLNYLSNWEDEHDTDLRTAIGTPRSLRGFEKASLVGVPRGCRLRDADVR